MLELPKKVQVLFYEENNYMMSLTKYRESIRIMFGVFWGLHSERIIVQVYCRLVV